MQIPIYIVTSKSTLAVGGWKKTKIDTTMIVLGVTSEQAGGVDLIHKHMDAVYNGNHENFNSEWTKDTDTNDFTKAMLSFTHESGMTQTIEFSIDKHEVEIDINKWLHG